VLAEDLGPGVRVVAWDVAFGDPASAASRNARALGVATGSDAVQAVRGAELVISAVTAANDVVAAASAAPGLADGCWFLDLNSAGPERKRAAARVVGRAGARYVEAAVMSPIMPKRLAAPILLGGPDAAAFAEFARPLGFTGLEPYADVVGPAAATKLCRSVVVKGMEALLAEAMLAARAWGVDERVLESLADLLGDGDGDRAARAAYMISRSLEHGVRRAEEMREAAATVAGTGIVPEMAAATARRQDWAAAYRDAAAEGSLVALLDAIRARLPEPKGTEE
jgi:3-hydroxyisobutyrate dehydrogenase-like beta-hydroxyacid dehydrogenase